MIGYGFYFKMTGSTTACCYSYSIGSFSSSSQFSTDSSTLWLIDASACNLIGLDVCSGLASTCTTGATFSTLTGDPTTSTFSFLVCRSSFFFISSNLFASIFKQLYIQPTQNQESTPTPTIAMANPLIQIIIQLNMAEEDYSKPRALAMSYFKDDLGDLQLPEHSTMYRGNQPAPPPNIRQSKYQQDIDEDFLEIDLKAQSKFVSKIPGNSASSSTDSSKSQKNEPIKEVKEQPSVKKNTTASRIQRRGKKSEPERKEVNIDNEIGEVAEWAEKGAKHNSDQQDFNDNNEGQKVAESEEQLQIRRKIQEKLKSGFNTEKQGGGGLRAKAEQLRKENENKSKLTQIKESPNPKPIEPIPEKKPKVDKYADKKQVTEDTDHNTSGVQLTQKKQQKPNLDLQDEEEDVDDHWNKINQQTINQISKAEQKRKAMNIKSVLEYFEKEFKFQEADIDDQEVGKGGREEEEEEVDESFFASLCACFSSPKKNKEAKTNFSIAKRLVAISKKQLSNGDEQYFLLKEIWTRLTGKEYSRYGAQWNEVGFQGRDPATDLRSTGILSLLQWLQFIQSHPQLSIKYYNWSLQFEYPLALTFIKLTGVFLDLLSKGTIRSSNWPGYQRAFNCLALGMFQKMMQKYKLGDTLGNFVEQQAREIKSEYKKLLASYQQEFKKMK